MNLASVPGTDTVVDLDKVSIIEVGSDGESGQIVFGAEGRELPVAVSVATRWTVVLEIEGHRFTWSEHDDPSEARQRCDELAERISYGRYDRRFGGPPV